MWEYRRLSFRDVWVRLFLFLNFFFFFLLYIYLSSSNLPPFTVSRIQILLARLYRLTGRREGDGFRPVGLGLAWKKKRGMWRKIMGKRGTDFDVSECIWSWCLICCTKSWDIPLEHIYTNTDNKRERQREREKVCESKWRIHCNHHHHHRNSCLLCLHFTHSLTSLYFTPLIHFIFVVSFYHLDYQALSRPISAPDILFSPLLSSSLLFNMTNIPSHENNENNEILLSISSVSHRLV